VIPASVQHIRAWAFERNPLRFVVFEGAGTEVNSNAFAHNSVISFIVGHPGSSAQTFADARGYRFVSMDNYRYSEGFHYAFENDAAEIIFYDGAETNMVIPAEVDGFPVTAIGADVFRGKGLS